MTLTTSTNRCQLKLSSGLTQPASRGMSGREGQQATTGSGGAPRAAERDRERPSVTMRQMRSGTNRNPVWPRAAQCGEKRRRAAESSAERSSAERSSAERSSAERSSAERSSAERSSAERSSAEREQRRAEQRSAAERSAAECGGERRSAAESGGVRRRAAECGGERRRADV